MYSKKEAAQLKKEFWTAFGQYMAPVRSVEGEKISWLNFKTSEKNILFRLDADNKRATVSIELTHGDTGVQALYFQQFRELKRVLEEATGEEWQWQPPTTDECGKVVTRICIILDGVSIFKREDWPKLISFFKPRIMALDDFWSNVKYSFDALR